MLLNENEQMLEKISKQYGIEPCTVLELLEKVNKKYAVEPYAVLRLLEYLPSMTFDEVRDFFEAHLMLKKLNQDADDPNYFWEVYHFAILTSVYNVM